MENKDLIQLTDYIIEKYHNPLREDFTKLTLFLDKIVEVHGYEHSEFDKIRSVFLSFKKDMLEHLFKEENILFPMMRQIQTSLNKGEKLGNFHCGSIKNPITQMEYEHSTFDQYLNQIKDLSNNFFIPEDACNAYTTTYKLLEKVYNDTLEHANLENNVLHTLAVESENKCKNI